MRHSRLQIFKNSTEAQDKYRQALRLLEEAGVFEVLHELAFPEPLPFTLPNRMDVAAAEHFKTAGYQLCMSDLGSLIEVAGEQKQQTLIADFGAIDAMLARGEITKEEAQKLRTQSNE